MDMALIISAFATLFVVIDPIGLTPVFIALTQGADAAHRRAVGIRACITALAILMLFAFFGEAVLGFIGISMSAFRISGGLEAMRGYWDRPRRAQAARRELDRGGKGALACRLAGMRGAETRKRVIEPKDRLWSVQPGGGAERPVHPYFWPHYLFDLQLHRSEPFRTAWAEVPKRPSYRHLMVRHWKRDYARMTHQELLSLLDAPMQKLSLKSAPSEKQLELIFGQAERATP